MGVWTELKISKICMRIIRKVSTLICLACSVLSSARVGCSHWSVVSSYHSSCVNRSHVPDFLPKNFLLRKMLIFLYEWSFWNILERGSWGGAVEVWGSTSHHQVWKFQKSHAMEMSQTHTLLSCNYKMFSKNKQLLANSHNSCDENIVCLVN